jgi:hypothetical protein
LPRVILPISPRILAGLSADEHISSVSRGCCATARINQPPLSLGFGLVKMNGWVGMTRPVVGPNRMQSHGGRAPADCWASEERLQEIAEIS